MKYDGVYKRIVNTNENTLLIYLSGTIGTCIAQVCVRSKFQHMYHENDNVIFMLIKY